MMIKTVDRERESPSAAVEVTTPVGGSGRNLSEGEGKEEDDDALPSLVQWSIFLRVVVVLRRRNALSCSLGSRV